MGDAKNQRRLARKQNVKNRSDRAVRNAQRARADADSLKREVFRLDDDGSGRAVSFDIQSMKRWAAQRLNVEHLAIDWKRVDRLATNGTVNPDHIFDHTIHQKLEPIIICRDAGGPREDVIVDGNHRYVAFALATKALGLNGLCIPAYILQPEQWRRFVISDAVMKTAFEESAS